MLLHDLLYLGDSHGGQHTFRGAGHDISYRSVEEIRLPAFHRPTDISVGDNTDDPVILQGNTQPELSFAHQDDGIT